MSTIPEMYENVRKIHVDIAGSGTSKALTDTSTNANKNAALMATKKELEKNLQQLLSSGKKPAIEKAEEVKAAINSISNEIQNNWTQNDKLAESSQKTAQTLQESNQKNREDLMKAEFPVGAILRENTNQQLGRLSAFLPAMATG